MLLAGVLDRTAELNSASQLRKQNNLLRGCVSLVFQFDIRMISKLFHESLKSVVLSP